MIGEDGAALRLAAGLEEFAEAGGVEDVVAEDEADVVGADELLAEHEGLGEAVRDGLLDVIEAAADARAVTEHLTEARQILREKFLTADVGITMTFFTVSTLVPSGGSVGGGTVVFWKLATDNEARAFLAATPDQTLGFGTRGQLVLRNPT